MDFRQQLREKSSELMKNEQVARLLVAAMEVSGKVNQFTAQQKERVAEAFGLVREEDHRKVLRRLAKLEADLARLTQRLKTLEGDDAAK